MSALKLEMGRLHCSAMVTIAATGTGRTLKSSRRGSGILVVNQG
jgi:hypothetical protein